MNPASIPVIWHKEFRDLLRDRKTLLTLLLLPTLLLPLLTLGLGRFAVHFVTREITREVTVAATPETRDFYHQIAHGVFLESDAARMLQGVQVPRIPWLPEGLYTAGAGLPREVWTDSEAFSRWARNLAVMVRDVAQDPPTDLQLPVPEPGTGGGVVPSMAGDFFDLVVRGVGLLNFTEPEFLVGPERGEDAALPAILADHPHGRGIHHALLTGKIDIYMDIQNGEKSPSIGIGDQIEILLVYDNTLPRSLEASSRLTRTIEMGNRRIVTARLAAMDLDGRFLEPLTIAAGGNIASPSRQLMAIFGGILPYLILVFAYMGGMYPAADLGAGEKERQTLETLLLSPVSRVSIAIAKYLVILTFSLGAALLGIFSLMVSIIFLLPPAVHSLIGAELGPGQILAVALLSIPPAAAFSGIFLGISIYARSYREAQNYMGPLALLLIVPGLAGMIPGIEPSWQLSLVPLVNVSLLCREAVKGSFDLVHYGLTIASCLALAALCIAFAVRLFRREEVLFRV